MVESSDQIQDKFEQSLQLEEDKVQIDPSADKVPKKTKFDQLQELVDDEVKVKWEAEQNELKKQLIEYDDYDWVLDVSEPDKTTLKYVAAIDISYSKKDDQKAVAALIICEYPSLKVIYEDYEKETTSYPYIPGFLAFKEIPVYTILFNRLKSNKPELWPQVLLVDGNGILHTRSFGCASHIGVIMNLPTIGVGKTVFAIDGITQIGVKQLCEKTLLKGGDQVDLEGDSGKVWGVAYRSTNESKNPIIISIGHKISQISAVKVVKACIQKYRIPEPSHQELFGYYMNQVLERKESDPDIVYTADEQKKESPENVQINNTLTKGFPSSQQKDPLLPFEDQQSTMIGAEHQLYRYRFFNLALYCMAAMINQICWISLQPAADAVSNGYGISTSTVNTISLVYMGVYLIVNFPSNYIIDTYGCRTGVVIGTVLTFVGMWVKVMINQSFAVCVVGQMIAAVGQPFLTNTPAKVSAMWFSEKGRIIATTIATVANPLGVAIGFVIPALFVGSEDVYIQNKDQARSDVLNSLICQAIIGTVVALMIVIFFREKPPTPPSSSQGVQKDPFLPSIKALFSNKLVILLMIIFGFIQGVFNTMGTVIGEISIRYGFSTDDASIYGAVFIIGGIVGSAAFGIWVEIKKKYKLAVILISLLSVLSTVGTSASFNSGESWLVSIFCFIVGFSMIPIMAVGFELGVEVTYPIDESYSTGLLMLAGQFLGIIYTVVSSQLIDSYGRWGCIISFIIYGVSLMISLVLSFFIKEDLRRQKHEIEKRHKLNMKKTQEIPYKRSSTNSEIENTF